MTKKEIIRALNSNVKRLQREYARSGSRELRYRLEEAERIRDAIVCQNSKDRRFDKLNNLL